MSALAGIVRFSGQPVTATDLAPAADRLHAAGVMEAACWTAGCAGLVVRQRIVTPEDVHERQPWHGANGRLTFVYDGRLDNREDVAAALGVPLTGDTVPDGWLLLQALERWGEAALPRLIGDFALALWDAANRRLLLARDQLGHRTLYYHQGRDFVAFATTYPALLALPGVPRRIDEAGIADFMVLNTHYPEQTFYEGLRRVPSASAAIFDSRGLRTTRYWTPEPRGELRLSSDEAYVEAAREQLDRAVRCRLRVHGALASTMTGGLDSSAVTATAARLLAPGRLLAVTSVPPEDAHLPPETPGKYNDERPFVTAIAAQHPNIDLVLASSRDPHWIETAPDPFFDAGGIPARAVSNIGWAMPACDAMQAAGIQAWLTGEGGNPGWSWNGMRGLAHLFRQGKWLRLARELALIGQARPYGATWKYVLRREILEAHEPPALTRWRRRVAAGDPELWSAVTAVNPAFAGEIRLYERCRPSGYDMRIAGGPDATAARLLPLKRRESGHDAATALRALTGIEPRAPLLDIRLLEFCFSLPHDQFLRDGIPRRLTRLALADRLPPAVSQSCRVGAQNPEILQRMSAMRAGLREEIASLQHSALAARCIDLPRLARIVAEWPASAEVARILPFSLHVARFLAWAERELEA